jgi:midasin
MAIDSGVREHLDAFEDDEDQKPEDDKAPAEPIEHAQDSAEDKPEGEEEPTAGAIIGESKDPSSERRNLPLDLEDQMDLDDEDDAGQDLTRDPSTTLSLPITRPHPEARALWQHYESSTKTLSAGLCEQLRLILEPTQATKMRGDYRTGKRLNMRRILPYIASEYKKDKIWMRRAKPSKRQYQVILAVDDSKSMAEGASSELALETVALVSRALSSLEVGQISVLSFGETTRVVHGFEAPFTSDSGVTIFENFTFTQQKTDVRALVETSLSLFTTARNQNSGTAELWQLEIVISDGVCEDHDMLRRLVRKAHEQRVMIVFVVVDSVRENSILELNSVKFLESGEIKTERYLDSFPFGYYLVVRDVNELPGVLAGALRQWFAESVESGI